MTPSAPQSNIKVQCPVCSQTGLLPEIAISKKIKCPKCSNVVEFLRVSTNAGFNLEKVVVENNLNAEVDKNTQVGLQKVGASNFWINGINNQRIASGIFAMLGVMSILFPWLNLGILGNWYGYSGLIGVMVFGFFVCSLYFVFNGDKESCLTKNSLIALFLLCGAVIFLCLLMIIQPFFFVHFHVIENGFPPFWPAPFSISIIGPGLFVALISSLGVCFTSYYFNQTIVSEIISQAFNQKINNKEKDKQRFLDEAMKTDEVSWPNFQSIKKFVSVPWLILVGIIGFLPWSHVSCIANPQIQISQTGFQELYGGKSLPLGSEKTIKDQFNLSLNVAKKKLENPEDEILGEKAKINLELRSEKSGKNDLHSPTIIFFWTSIFSLIAVSIILPFSKFRFITYSGFCLLAILVLVCQLIFGSPLEQLMRLKVEAEGVQALAQISYGKTIWFWITFVLVFLAGLTEFIIFSRKHYESKTVALKKIVLIVSAFLLLSGIGVITQFVVQKQPIWEKEKQLAEINKKEEENNRKIEVDKEQMRLEMEQKKQEIELEKKKLDLEFAMQKQKAIAEENKRKKEAEELKEKQMVAKKQADLEALDAKQKAMIASEEKKKKEAEDVEKAKQKAVADIAADEADRKKKFEAKGQTYYPLPRTVYEDKTADQWYQIAVSIQFDPTQINQPPVGIIGRRPGLQPVDNQKKFQEAINALIALKEEGTPFLLEALQKQTTTQGRAFYLQAIKGELVHPNDVPVIMSSLTSSKNQIQTRMIALRALAKNPSSKKHYEKIRGMVADLFPNNNVKIEVGELLKAIEK